MTVQRRIVGVVAVLVGLVLLVSPFVLDYPTKTKGVDDLTDNFRSTFSDTGLAQARTDMDTVNAFVGQFEREAAPEIVAGLGTGIIFIAYPAMMADAAEEHELLFGTRREGLFFSGLGFAGKAAGGVGALVGGLALDLLRFPREMGRKVDAVISEDVLVGLALGWGPLPALLCVVGAFVFAPYAITRARHEQIIAALRTKRAADVSAGRSS